MIDLEQIERQYTSLIRNYDKESGRKEQLISRKYDLESEVEQYNNEQVVLQKTTEALKTLLERLSNENIGQIEKLVTLGLNTIFGDHYKDIKFRIDATTKRDQLNYEFMLEVDGVEGPLDGTHGGGMICVISLILRLLISVNLGLYPFVLLDESLAAVSVEFQKRTADFLRTVAEQLNVDMLLVTHQDQFAMGANKRYRCHKDDKEQKLIMKLE